MASSEIEILIGAVERIGGDGRETRTDVREMRTMLEKITASQAAQAERLESGAKHFARLDAAVEGVEEKIEARVAAHQQTCPLAAQASGTWKTLTIVAVVIAFLISTGIGVYQLFR